MILVHPQGLAQLCFETIRGMETESFVVNPVGGSTELWGTLGSSRILVFH